MTKRIRPNLNIPVIASLEEADETMARIAALKRELAMHELELKEGVDTLKLKCAAMCEPAQEEIERLGAALARFGDARKGELFTKKRSLDLNFGIIGFRASHSLKPLRKTTWDQVLGFLQASKMTEYIRMRQEVDKEALRQLPPEKLAEIGCRMVYSDTFYYELKEAGMAEADIA